MEVERVKLELSSVALFNFASDGTVRDCRNTVSVAHTCYWGLSTWSATEYVEVPVLWLSFSNISEINYLHINWANMKYPEFADYYEFNFT